MIRSNGFLKTTGLIIQLTTDPCIENSKSSLISLNELIHRQRSIEPRKFACSPIQRSKEGSYLFASKCQMEKIVCTGFTFPQRTYFPEPCSNIVFRVPFLAPPTKAQSALSQQSDPAIKGSSSGRGGFAAHRLTFSN